MDHAARNVMEEYPDIILAFGESDEYRLVSLSVFYFVFIFLVGGDSDFWYIIEFVFFIRHANFAFKLSIFTS